VSLVSFLICTLWQTLILSLVQSNTSVPIPTILEWSDDCSNSIGSEYIIMEPAVGTQLHQKWPEMSVEQSIDCIRAISTNIQQLAGITFSAYGSLYFSDAPIDSAYKLPLAQGFSIGPRCGTWYWHCNVSEPRYYNSVKPNRGPCEIPASRFAMTQMLIRCVQGLILRHTATALSIVAFPGFRVTKPFWTVHISMDLLQRTPVFLVSVGM
jgi:hypothetical protein